MTSNYMLMVPRSCAKFEDKLGINACGVYGLILCKNQELFDMVKEIGPLEVLQKVCLPNASDLHVDEYSY